MSAEKHKQICDKLHETYKAKNKDYGNSFEYCYNKFGLSSPLTRILDKTFRLENLILNGKAEVTDESISDTLLDLANYAIMTAMLADKGMQDGQNDYILTPAPGTLEAAQKQAYERSKLLHDYIKKSDSTFPESDQGEPDKYHTAEDFE